MTNGTAPVLRLWCNKMMHVMTFKHIWILVGSCLRKLIRRKTRKQQQI
jgi:hypothetical protein